MTIQATSRGVHRKAIIIAAILSAAFCLTSWAAADAPQQDQGPCAGDFAKFCRDIQPGVSRMAACLKEHENDFSAACREHIAMIKERSRQFQEACREDGERLCKDVQPGGGRLMKCLKAHEAELSATCREKMPKGRRGK